MNVLHHDGVEVLLELWIKDKKKDKTTHLGNLPVTSANSIKTLQSFADSVDRLIGESDARKKKEQAILDSNRRFVVEFLYDTESSGNGGGGLTVTRSGPGASRSVSIPVTEETVNGLKELPQVLNKQIGCLLNTAKS